MKKNTIFIVIDSIYYDKTLKQNYRNTPMPFLNKLRSEGLDFTKMYSEAPYTEAALVSLLCGIDTLKKGGYAKKLYGKETIMETFQKNGYETFCNCVQPLVFPSYSYQGLDEEYYNIAYDFETLWSYRLEFYSNLYKKEKLDNKTIDYIVELLDDNLKTWINFLNALKNKEKKVSFIIKYMKIENLEENINLLSTEIEKYNKNKKEYTINLLSQGKEHNLFKIHNYNLNNKMSENDMKKVYHKYKKIIRKMFFKNLKLNLINNKLILNPKEERKGLIKAYINAVYNRFLYKKIDYKIASKKAAPSMHTTFKHFENWIQKRQSDKPYFAYIHLDDVHSGEMFYTYDTQDFNLLDEEFNNINNFMDNIPKKYKGSVSYDAALLYADTCLKRLYDFLEKNNMLDNVNIAICADHGSSYTFDPYRYKYVNTIHRENYNMPFVVWSKDLKHKTIDNFHNTKDIPATLLDLNNIEIPKEYDGISALKKETRDYVLIENVMGGCPDYNLRDFWLGIRTKKYLVVVIANKNKEFKDLELYAVYNLIKDKEELYNLKDTIDRDEIKEELKIIEKEFNILKEDMKNNNFLDYKVGDNNA